MIKWGSTFAAAALAVTPSSAAVLVYELTLVTDAPYTAFGGGPAGDVFIGTFGFDDSLLGSPGAVFEPILSTNAFFLTMDLNGTLFSTGTPGTTLDNGLRFDGGPLADVFFDLTNPNGDRLEIRTDHEQSPFIAFWRATDPGRASTVGGDTFPASIAFTLIPEPGTTAILGLGVLLLLLRRRRA